MIDIKKIEAAAQKWAIDNKRKFPHLTIPEFTAGALWAIKEIENKEIADAVKCKYCGSTDLFLDHGVVRCSDCGGGQHGKITTT